MARTTYTEISHRLTDITAKSEAGYSMTDLLGYSSFSDIKTDDFIPDDIMSDERNHNILDGSLKLIPAVSSDLNWGAWSNSKSDASGNFTTNPILTAVFTNPHTSSGITLAFSGDAYPKQIQVTWYSGTTVLASQTFTVDSMLYFCDRTVENYNKVVLTFIGMSLPRRHLKIGEIDYGQIKVWSKGDVLSANILEEVNLTSSEISINTLEFSVHDENEEFNMLNPDGVYAALQEKQRLSVKQYINDAPMLMGRFYLDTWENTSATVAEFTAYDAIGLLEKCDDYKTSSMWTSVAASVIFADIFAAAGWTNYTVESAIASELVSGYIPICTIREALHHLCLALRCSCIPNRTGTIEIKRLPSGAATKLIGKSRKFGSPTIKQNALVNSVAVTSYEFSAASGSTQLYADELAVGTYEITFNRPATGLTVSGATIVKSGINYAKITVAAAGTVTITGHLYESQTSVYTYEADGVTAANRAQKAVSNVFLVSSMNAASLAQFLYDDYQRRIVQKFSMAVEDENPGDNVDVDTMLGARKTGVVTSMDIDLTGGFIADMEVRG